MITARDKLNKIVNKLVDIDPSPSQTACQAFNVCQEHIHESRTKPSTLTPGGFCFLGLSTFNRGMPSWVYSKYVAVPGRGLVHAKGGKGLWWCRLSSCRSRSLTIKSWCQNTHCFSVPSTSSFEVHIWEGWLRRTFFEGQSLVFLHLEQLCTW